MHNANSHNLTPTPRKPHQFPHNEDPPPHQQQPPPHHRKIPPPNPKQAPTTPAHENHHNPRLIQTPHAMELSAVKFRSGSQSRFPGEEEAIERGGGEDRRRRELTTLCEE
ncbi:hypothetical protein KC19_3G201200 [Ceratodon purpureus]|uniref:Uncharacterized protein n=1 Tax=Ceratodon purpureus TaxID=3225 RepID=A0A8T0IPE5_CERPU|nr:hypothetical protein KC19_3G201200 [Ceratodon purpureus]